MKDDKSVLYAIVKHCESIEEKMESFGRNKDKFISNRIFQDGCAFNVFLIGDIVKHLSSGLTNSNRDIDWKRIARWEDIIMPYHERDSPETQWITINEEIPKLKESCKRILDLMQ